MMNFLKFLQQVKRKRTKLNQALSLKATLKNTRGFSAGFLTFILVHLCCLSPAYGDQTVLRKLWNAPPFSGKTVEGEEWASSKIIPGKVVLVNFFFSSCKGPCPAMMQKIQRVLAKSECENIAVVSISVDPDRDDPQTLKKYQSDLGIDDPRWVLLSAPQETVISLLNDGFKLGSGGDIINHSTRIVLVDQNGLIRALAPGTEDTVTSTLLSGIQELCKD